MFTYLGVEVLEHDCGLLVQDSDGGLDLCGNLGLGRVVDGVQLVLLGVLLLIDHGSGLGTGLLQDLSGLGGKLLNISGVVLDGPELVPAPMILSVTHGASPSF